MRKASSVLVALCVAVGGVLAAGPAADAAPTASAVARSWAAADGRAEVRGLSAQAGTELQEQIDRQLATTRGGVQISANEVSYNGDPIVVFPLPGHTTAPAASKAALKQQGVTAAQIQALSESPAAATGGPDWHGCPAGKADNRWYCFYEDKDWRGRRLQWNNEHCSTPVHFSGYGFEGQTSSWVNTGALQVNVYTSGGTGLWRELPGTMVSYVGDAMDNKAGYFYACK
ncbi:peptidase inhibitor family I36 protein [Kitasatospora sp. NPDC094019]|uniref:peptidase inhibitor family I36 protein n=1 Tax=Kitasatospora sp. NPDC094019 TaxID=3364091 RepID=UPI003817AA96